MKDTTPAVSVMMPCYNVTRYVGEALDSLRAQTFRNFETIIVNDGCPDSDNLERVLEPYRDEVVYIRQENQGCGGAKNTAIRVARAPLVALLDPDDVWEPGYLEEQTAFFSGHPEAACVYPESIFIGDHPWSGKIRSDVVPFTQAEITYQGLVSQNCGYFGQSMFRRSWLMRAGLYDPELRVAEDFELFLRMTKLGAKFLFNPKVLYRYRLRRGSLTDDHIDHEQCYVRASRKSLATLDLTPDERRCAEEAIRRREAFLDLLIGKRAVYRAQYAEAIESLSRAHAANPTRKLRMAILLLRVWPGLLSAYVRSRYRTEYAYVH